MICGTPAGLRARGWPICRPSAATQGTVTPRNQKSAGEEAVVARAGVRRRCVLRRPYRRRPATFSARSRRYGMAFGIKAGRRRASGPQRPGPRGSRRRYAGRDLAPHWSKERPSLARASRSRLRTPGYGRHGGACQNVHFSATSRCRGGGDAELMGRMKLDRRRDDPRPSADQTLVGRIQQSARSPR